jgi:hypothetical protein
VTVEFSNYTYVRLVKALMLAGNGPVMDDDEKSKFLYIAVRTKRYQH